MKDYIFRKNLSVKQLAATLEISTSYLYQLIRGERKPSLELAQKIEECTGGEITVGKLLGFKEEGPPLDEKSSIDEYEPRISLLENCSEKFSCKLEQFEERLSRLEEKDKSR